MFLVLLQTKFVKLTGFTTDKAFSLFAADFKIVREMVVPLAISIIYRDLSDFNGIRANNTEKLKTYFGTTVEFADTGSQYDSQSGRANNIQKN